MVGIAQTHSVLRNASDPDALAYHAHSRHTSSSRILLMYISCFHSSRTWLSVRPSGSGGHVVSLVIWAIQCPYALTCIVQITAHLPYIRGLAAAAACERGLRDDHADGHLPLKTRLGQGVLVTQTNVIEHESCLFDVSPRGCTKVTQHLRHLSAWPRTYLVLDWLACDCPLHMKERSRGPFVGPNEVSKAS